MSPTGSTSSAPPGPSRTLVAKKGKSVTVEATYEHSYTSGSPERPRRHASAMRAAAYAMDRVAEPAPALASTTSVPAFWILTVSFSSSSAVNSEAGYAWDRRGRMVIPAWPPTTGTSTSFTSKPFACATNVFALTTSRVDTPKSFLGSYVPACLKISAAIGTVLFTGLLMMLTSAPGQFAAIATHKSRTIPALIANKSSRDIPGFLGIPAGMTTRSHPVSASASESGPS
mmetsp:Transcript_6500/g.24528  ORF Transcript_6500/g.24528 Transcript_6500/m.24528 type:complete len:229 (-) Transcript_6500:341-1027(-)